MNLFLAPSGRLPAGIPFSLIVLLAVIWLSACSSAAPARLAADQSALNTPKTDQATKLASNDFLSVLPQLLDPRSTTVHVGPDDSNYTRKLLLGLKKLGYGVRRVTTDQGPRFMSFTESVATHSGNTRIQGYTIYMGNLGLERDYLVENGTGQARPASPLRIIGSRKKVKLDAESGLGIAQSSAALVNRVIYVKDQRAAAVALSPPARKQTYNSHFKRVSDARIQFDAASSEWQTLQKSKLNNLVKLYNEETDFFSIIICAQENAIHRPAQEKLSIERLLRVSRGLQDLGIKAAVIHTDYCAADATRNPTHAANPSVLVELRR